MTVRMCSLENQARTEIIAKKLGLEKFGVNIELCSNFTVNNKEELVLNTDDKPTGVKIDKKGVVYGTKPCYGFPDTYVKGFWADPLIQEVACRVDMNQLEKIRKIISGKK